jgi:hypothetical protein
MEGEAMRKMLRAGALAAVILAAGGAVLFAEDGRAGTAAAAVRAMIGTLALGEPVRFENLTIIPLSGSSKRMPAAAVPLDEALKKGWLRIRELDDGDVPRLVVDNRGDGTVFIMGGEVVTGGKQDRLIGGDVLLRPHVRGVVIPVYCVEAGRWTETSAQFGTKQNLGTWQLRANAQAAAPAAQERIWGEVDKMQDQAGAGSATGAYQDIYEDGKVNKRLLALEKGLKNVPRLASGTVGVLCAVGGKVVSVDAFSDPTLFERLWPKILRASALSAVTERAAGRTTRKSALVFLGRLSDSRFAEAHGIDLGTDVRSDGGEITASALVHDGVVLHLSAFPVAQPLEDRMQAPGNEEPAGQQGRD